MRITNILVNSIKPDTDQPRKTFDPIIVEEMAKSFAAEGIINPIEIDENNIIITGEMRWRAAKVAGMDKVPCKVIPLHGRERFRRQMVENLHHNTMNPMDTARGMKKMLVDMGWKPMSEAASLINAQKGTKGFTGNEYVSSLSKEIGKSEKYIYQMLSLLKEKKRVQKWLEAPESVPSYIEEANRVPKEHIETVKKKIVKGDFPNKEALRETVRAIKHNPDKAEEILNLNLADKNQIEASNIIRELAHEDDPVGSAQAGGLAIIKFNELLKLVRKIDPETILQGDRKRILDLRDELTQELVKFEFRAMIDGESLQAIE